MLRLGSFILDAPLGEGGMAQVWAATHVHQKARVAIKVVHRDPKAHPRFAEALNREVLAVAGLDHPHITALIDTGEVPRDAALQAAGLRVGAPYMVMPMADSTLRDRAGQLDWSAFEQALQALLAGLAHAHSRGVIHRDLKPANALYFPSDRIWRLTDFGIAWAGTPDDSRIRGTPRYMSPEQLRGQWRDLGPWTDLYALGVLGWEWACGGAPFEGEVRDMVQGHLARPLPPFSPVRPVPDGFEHWLRRLLRKTPSHRFQSAAEAAWSLNRLGHPGAEAVVAALKAGPGPSLSTSSHTWTDLDPSLPDAVPPSPVIEDEVIAVLRPPLPEASPDTHPRRQRLAGVGLGLLGVRQIPLFGRSHERRTLWTALRSSVETPQTVVLRGPTGIGKSHLASWLCQHAHSHGGAVILQSTHSPQHGPTDGLVETLRSWSSSHGLDDDALAEHLRQRITALGGTDPRLWHTLANLMSDTPQAAVPWEDRVRVLAQWARLLSRHRPLVWWIDDAQWGETTVELAEQLLDQDVPLLLVVTLNDEFLPETPSIDDQLVHLQQRDGARTIHMEPLPLDQTQAMLHSVLGLEIDLAAQVAAHTQGHPLFALQLVIDWANQDALVEGISGYRLRTAQIQLPSSLTSVWREHADQLSADPDQREALEVAAALGVEVIEDEWRRVCTAMQLPFPAASCAKLQQQGLLVPTDQGYRFAHGLYRATLEQRSVEAGRWGRIHATCAMTFRSYPARYGRHLVHAGQLRRALEPLLEGANRADYRGELATMLVLLHMRSQIMHQLELPESDERWGQTWELIADYHRRHGAMDEARHWSNRALEAARAYDWIDTEAAATSTLALIAIVVGNVAQAEAMYVEMLDKAEKRGAIEAALRTSFGLIELLRNAGRMTEADALLQTSIDRTQAIGDYKRACRLTALRGEVLRQMGQHGEGRAMLEEVLDHPLLHTMLSTRARMLRTLANIHEEQGNLATAEQLLRQSLLLYDQAGNPTGAADAVNDLAEVARRRGNFDQAERGYRDAIARYQALGIVEDVVARTNLGLVLIARGRLRDARRMLAEALLDFERTRRPGWVAAISVVILPTLVDDPAAFAQHARRAVDMLPDYRFADRDVLSCAMAAARGMTAHPALAEMALELAALQAQWLGDTETANEVEHLRDSLKG